MDLKKFLVVSTRSRTKKVVVQEPWTIELVSTIVKERFNLEAPVLTFYDNDVNEYVDLDNDSIHDVENYTVLKVKCLEENVIDTSLDTSLNTTSLTPSKADTAVRSTSTPIRAVTVVDQCQNVEASPIRNQPPLTTGQSLRRKPWPKIYQLPAQVLPRGLKLKLDGGDDLDKTDRRHLLESIYNDVTSYDGGMYPTSAMYDAVVDSLLRDFPGLLHQNGLPPASNRVYLKEKIVFKFGNARKRVDQTLPEVKSRRRVKKVDQTASSNTPPVWGLQNYLPPLPVSEDDTSITRHMQWMAREVKKTSPDTEQLDRLLSLTFPARRRCVVEEKMPVTEVLDQYPALQSERQLLLEFKRLAPTTKTSDLKELLLAGIKPYRQAMVESLRNKKLPPILKEAMSAHGEFHNADQRQYAEDCIVLLGLPVLFKEGHSKMIEVGPSAEREAISMEFSCPALTLQEDRFTLLCEGKPVITTGSFVTLFTSMVAFIYAFNMAYPRAWSKTLSFVQEVFLGLKDSERLHVNKKHLTVMTMLNRHKK